MIRAVATNITSPLGFTSEQNYLAVKAGTSALKRLEEWRGIPEPLTAAVFSEDQTEAMAVEGFTRFESLVIRSVGQALSTTTVDVTSARTVFILSTTKANVDELLSDSGAYSAPGDAALKIARHLGFSNVPITVCNACISGVTAQILADRLISAGEYDAAVVCGADCVTPFTVAGFLSLKSLSADECRPFDIERTGLNLGEAAATIIYVRDDSPVGDGKGWKLAAGCLNNDAYHISSPSPTGEGVLNAVRKVMGGAPSCSPAFINAHGTATMFNDQMESKAIERSGLSDIPVTALKAYFGHTLGAAGVLETVMSICAADDGYILPTRGFSENGVSGKISVCTFLTPAARDEFLKIISGFGGCNGAMLMARDYASVKDGCAYTPDFSTAHSVHITSSSIEIDGENIPVGVCGRQLLEEVYRTRINDYPKFHKMDMFGKLVFAAAELLFRAEGACDKDEDRAVVLFNASSSIVADRQHVSTISSDEGFFPSPSVFVYTLPNIAAGEVAIRNACHGETSLYILDHREDSIIDSIVRATFAFSDVRSMIAGWADCSSEDDFEADLKILSRI